MEAKKRLRVQKSDHMRLLLGWVIQGKTMASFCRRSGSPKIQTIYEWLRTDLAFSEDLREAKFVGYDVMSQDCLEIADFENMNDVSRARLRIETRLKLLARWDTARYGDKILVGGDGGDPIRVMNDGQVMDEIMGLLALAKARQISDKVDSKAVDNKPPDRNSVENLN